MNNTLYYGDNLEVLRRYLKDETVDLCYIDPPFNSKRNYNQIYNNIGGEDRAQAQAFVDTWTWDDQAADGFSQILANDGGRFTAQTIDLISGLHLVLKKGSLLAYLVSMTLRITEIHRALKPTGSFYLHCDPTASHYLKIVLDSIFVTQGGEFRNEIIWHYLKWSVKQKQFVRNHDVVLFYSKTNDPDRVFHTFYMERSPATAKRFGNAKIVSGHDEAGNRLPSQVEDTPSQGVALDDVWDISRVPPVKQLYPTQKPELLLQRIIMASTNEGDTVLDAYCGCGTTISVAEDLKRCWIGIDITYQSISLILRRLEAQFGKPVLDSITLSGIPRDMASAQALAHKKDDRVRKEFEKWAVLTYTDNRAVINSKKGADAGVDGIAYTSTGYDATAKIILQVKSGKVERADIAVLNSDRLREGAEMAVLLTLAGSTKNMRDEAKGIGPFHHPLMQKNYDRVQIVTVEEMLQGKRLDVPMSLEVVKKAQAVIPDSQLQLLPE